MDVRVFGFVNVFVSVGEIFCDGVFWVYVRCDTNHETNGVGVY